MVASEVKVKVKTTIYNRCNFQNNNKKKSFELCRFFYYYYYLVDLYSKYEVENTFLICDTTINKY